MMQALDPTIHDASLAQLKKDLAKYIRANQQQRKKLGGPGKHRLFLHKKQPLNLQCLCSPQRCSRKSYIRAGEQCEKNISHVSCMPAERASFSLSPSEQLSAGPVNPWEIKTQMIHLLTVRA